MKKYVVLAALLGVVRMSSVQAQVGSYTPFGYITSTEYAVIVLGNLAMFSNNPDSSFYTLFPDSLTVSYTDYINQPNENQREPHFPAIGFVFDPYSKAYDTLLAKRLFENTNGDLYKYRIDSLFVVGQYRMANYSPLSPDTLRVFLSYYNAYNFPDTTIIDPKNGQEYLTTHWIRYENYNVIVPIIKYEDRNNIAQKGAVTMPAAENTLTINYILSDKDSVNLSGGLGGYKTMAIPADFEVPVGSVTSILMKYIPGYNYNNGDTILKTSYIYPTNTWVAENLNKNVFSAAIILNRHFECFTDLGDGFNGRLMEDMNIRYDTEESLRNEKWNLNHLPIYHYRYHAIPYAYMFVSTDTVNRWNSVSETLHTNASLRIYPNPANYELKISLPNPSEGGAYERDVIEIYNVVGQKVGTYPCGRPETTINVEHLPNGMYYIKVNERVGKFVKMSD